MALLLQIDELIVASPRVGCWAVANASGTLRNIRRAISSCSTFCKARASLRARRDVVPGRPATLAAAGGDAADFTTIPW
jgi:hypothetical protein